MIVKVQPARKHTSNAKRLQEYLTFERMVDEREAGDVNTDSFTNLERYLTTGRIVAGQVRRQRGDTIRSDNLPDLETAAVRMQGTAANNFRCKDPILHYELAWPHDERPTRKQWANSALETLKALGYGEHQYLVVAHDDRRHFHIHIMVNKVHPETFKVNDPHQSWITLDKTVRKLEATYGWKHTPGLTRWNDVKQAAVELKRSERYATAAQSRPTSRAVQYEYYNDAESLQTHVRKEIAPSVRNLLSQRGVQWKDLHSLLARAHLRLEKAQKGGYTVASTDYNIRVKASDVFRHDFAGKANRKRVELKLGPWSPAQASHREANSEIQSANAPDSRQQSTFVAPAPHMPPERDQAKRAERLAARHEARTTLKSDYAEYRNKHLVACRQITGEGRVRAQQLRADLRLRKRQIRTGTESWASKKALISQEVARSVLETRALRRTTLERRRAAWPQTYRAWVFEKAAVGDTRAVAQLRGWYYQDQRNQRKLTARLEPTGLHLQAPKYDQDPRVWAQLVPAPEPTYVLDASAKQQTAVSLAWKVDRLTGDVAYSVYGAISVIDRGRIVSVLSRDEAAILFGLEMAIKKYGMRLECAGTAEWKRDVVETAVRHSVTVQFSDPQMQQLKMELQAAADLANQRRFVRVIRRTKDQISR